MSFAASADVIDKAMAAGVDGYTAVAAYVAVEGGPAAVLLLAWLGWLRWGKPVTLTLLHRHLFEGLPKGQPVNLHVVGTADDVEIMPSRGSGQTEDGR
jgi:hypothetical protein